MGEFADRVFEVVCQIPKGKVATYGQVARLVGRPRSARYVGYALRANPRPGIDPDSIPCHRVVFKDGSLCKSFAFGGPDVQLKMLREEGVTFSEAPCAEDACDGVRVTADLGDGEGERTVRLADIRVDMATCQWDGRAEPGARGYTAAAAGEGAVAGATADEDDGRGAYPTEPPAFFDWKVELGE